MKARHVNLLCVDGRTPVTFEGQRDGEELLDGLLLAGGRTIGQICKGVASFVERDQWPDIEMAKLRQQGFTARKLHNPQFAHDERHEPLVKALLETDGPILEIAAGPSGGHFPLILRHRPDADILVNDVSPGILALWHEALASARAGPNVSLAAFDAAAMPLRDDCFGGISAVVGFGSVRRSQQAIHEAHRVLRHGGVLCATELIIAAETFEQVPTSVREQWTTGRIPIIERGVRGFLEEEGFVVDAYRREYLREGDPDEDPPAKLAAEHGVTLRYECEWIVAHKHRPEGA